MYVVIMIVIGLWDVITNNYMHNYYITALLIANNLYMNEIQQDVIYIPSSVETKKALLLYLFLGIMVALVKKEVSVYEIYHIQQAIGWRMVFVLSFISGSILRFIPYVWMIVWIPFAILVWFRLHFVRQAWAGLYVLVLSSSPLSLFAGLGQRMLFVFDFHFTIMWWNQIWLDQSNSTDNVSPKNISSNT